MSYAGLKFGIPNVKYVCNGCKTHCNASNFINITQKLFGWMSCNFEYLYLKLLKIDFC